jgi:3-deoxy-D-arabino-heptulosonate 7-phosphate (DAHP) synthase class II
MQTPLKIKEMYKDIWALTPAEIANLMNIAAWMLEYPDKHTAGDRHTIADQLRRTMKQVNPSAYSSMDGAAEYYRQGVYNGD